MCFSAEASFTSSVVLSGFGVAAYKNLSRRPQLLFASIPLVFAFQQFTEGVLWLTIPAAHEYELLQKITTYIFLIMAQALWPVLLPVSVLLLEEDTVRKKLIYAFLALGGVVVLYYGYGILTSNVQLSAKNHYIQYQEYSKSAYTKLFFALYTLAAIVPLFVSSVKGTSKMGLLMLGSCIVTLIFFVQFLTSVWCFFAAIISFLVYKILKDSNLKTSSEFRVRSSE
ncbi:MAG: hypothetical protein LHV68_09575 [Elusimicrobia bacterium]|nr:hypothetical protein [Candidatus Liberimonas magnetica]